jgi:threonine/homoserine/homoserine lactone efflux protein
MSLPPEIFLFVISTAITPGPNNVMLMTSGLNHGIRKSVPHLVGINVGFTLMLIIIGMGLGSAFDSYPLFHQTIKIAGVLYLAYLAWMIAVTPTETQQLEKAKPITFLQAALFQWVNPKAWVMITGAVGSFTTQSTNIYLQVLMIAGTFAVLGTPCGATWLLSGVSLRRFLENPKYLRIFNRTMAILLIISIRPVIMELISHD